MSKLESRLTHSSIYKIVSNTPKFAIKVDWSALYFLLPIKLNRIPTGYRSLVLCVGVNQGGENEFNLVFDQARTTSDNSFRNDLLFSAACTKDSILQLK